MSPPLTSTALSALKRLAGVVLLAAGVALAAQAGGVVTLVTDEEKRGGYLVEIATEILKRQGYEARIEYMPWPRALSLVMEGSASGLLGAYYTKDRAERLLYSEPLAESELVFFALKGSGIDFNGLESLKPYAIGTVRGTRYPPAFEQASYLNKLEARTFEVNIKNLLDKRIALFVEKKGVVLDDLNSVMPADACVIHDLRPPLAIERFHVCFSRLLPEGPERIKVIDRGLALLRADGTYKRIMKRGLHE